MPTGFPLMAVWGRTIMSRELYNWNQSQKIENWQTFELPVKRNGCWQESVNQQRTKPVRFFPHWGQWSELLSVLWHSRVTGRTFGPSYLHKRVVHFRRKLLNIKHYKPRVLFCSFLKIWSLLDEFQHSWAEAGQVRKSSFTELCG